MTGVNIYRIVGNAGTAFVSTIISVFTANGTGITEIPGESVIKLAVLMGFLYALLAFFHEMQRIGGVKREGLLESSAIKPTALESLDKRFRISSTSMYLPF